MPTVPVDFPVNEDARYIGKVSFYSKLKGYGFIDVAQEGVAPENRLFVHWRNIQSDDRFPFLQKDMDVQFGISKQPGMGAKPGEMSLRAKEVTLPNGGSVNLQEALDAEQKTFVGGQQARYQGTLRFFNPRLGYGFITLAPGTTLDGYGGDKPVPAEIRVERSEVNAGGQQPVGAQDIAVEFGIWKTNRDELKAYNMSLPGGVPMTMAHIEHRQAFGGQMYRGEVSLWNWSAGWGFIKADASVAFPPDVQAKLTQQAQEAKERALKKNREGSDEELLYVRREDITPGVRLEKGMQVMFQIYTDDKGVGATQVQAI